MTLLIKTADSQFAARPIEFASEAELEEVVASRPDLLMSEGDARLALVARQVSLPDAGLLDLLFVSEAGLPVAIEVKLMRNGESRRLIVAQIVDYLSSLTRLTVDELDTLVNGALEVSLRSFDSEDSQAFERGWQSVGANLRAGLARVVLVLDRMPADLERIVRFLSQHTNLDIRLVTIGKYEADGIGSVFVPHIAVSSDEEVISRPARGPRRMSDEFAAVVSAYDEIAPEGLRTLGRAANYRQIKPPEWPAKFNIHYEFMQSGKAVDVELHLENANAKGLAVELQRLANTKIGPKRLPLEWDPKWSNNRGRLRVRFDAGDDPSSIAQTMLDFIGFSRSNVLDLISKHAESGKDRPNSIEATDQVADL